MNRCPDGTPHRWLLESPSGSPFCRGECKKCGSVRDDFRTSTEEVMFGVNTSAGGVAFANRREMAEQLGRVL